MYQSKINNHYFWGFSNFWGFWIQISLSSPTTSLNVPQSSPKMDLQKCTHTPSLQDEEWFQMEMIIRHWANSVDLTRKIDHTSIFISFAYILQCLIIFWPFRLLYYNVDVAVKSLLSGVFTFESGRVCSAVILAKNADKPCSIMKPIQFVRAANQILDPHYWLSYTWLCTRSYFINSIPQSNHWVNDSTFHKSKTHPMYFECAYFECWPLSLRNW